MRERNHPVEVFVQSGVAEALGSDVRRDAVIPPLTDLTRCDRGLRVVRVDAYDDVDGVRLSRISEE